MTSGAWAHARIERCLVTGGLGFIGSHFIRLLLRERPDIEVINLDAMTYAGNPLNLHDLEDDSRYRFVHGNIADRTVVRAAIGAGVDAIVNFAAESHVDRSLRDATAFCATNVCGTQVLLDAAREYRVQRFLQVSTDEVYGDIPEGESTEDDPLRPRSPYSASKAAADLLALAHYESYDAPVLITRGSNTYGPYQYPEKLIPLFVTNLIDDQLVPVYGDGMQVRDWLYVEDHARGILHVLEHGEPGNVYNLGGNNPRTNLDITHMLLKACGRSPLTHVHHVGDRPGHDRRYAMNTEKARALGWEPGMPFVAGLHRTIDWYKANERWWRPLKSGDFAEYYALQYQAAPVKVPITTGGIA